MSRIIIAQFQGVSLISKIIRLFTRSKWSHTACILQDNSVVEAWHNGGVSHINYHSGLIHNLSKNHTPGTKVDLFYIEATLDQAQRFDTFLLSIVGAKYDFRAVWRFVNRVPAIINDKWFCTEAAVNALNRSNIYPQVRIKSSEMSPQLLGISPLMIKYDQVVTI